MRNRKQFMAIIVLAAATVLLAVGGGTAQGQTPPPPPPFGGPRGLDLRLLNQLGLTDAQQTQIKALLDEERTASQPYQEALMQAREAIRTAVEAGSFDETAVRGLAAIVGKATTELTVVGARTQAAVYQVLTPDQRSKLAELRKQHGPPPR